MRVSFGKGGWVGVDGIGLPGPMYVRVREGADKRLKVSEIYIDGSESDNDITQSDLRGIKLSAVEALINAHYDSVVGEISTPGPDLSTLATYFQTVVMGDPQKSHWAHVSLASQDAGFSEAISRYPHLRPAPKIHQQWEVVSDDRDFRLKSGPVEGLTDDFLREVARAYMAAVARGERPNQAIQEQTKYSIKSVERWVYTARQRGIMPRGRQGKVG